MDKKTQQRLAQHSQPKHPQYQVTRPAMGGPLQIGYAHDGTLVYITFSRVTDHVALSPTQVDEMIRCLEQGKRNLAEHQAAGGSPTTQGPDRAQ